MNNTNELIHLQKALGEVLGKLNCSQAKSTDLVATSRWAYIDSTFSRKNDIGVLFAALEFEIADYSQFHPAPEWSDKLSKRWVREMGNSPFDELNRTEQFCKRMYASSALHAFLMADGYVLSDLVTSYHPDGQQCLARYSKPCPDLPNYCYQLRVVYVPHDFDTDEEGPCITRDSVNPQYVIVNYNAGEIDNIDTHDAVTGQLIRRLTVEARVPNNPMQRFIYPKDPVLVTLTVLGDIYVTQYRIDDSGNGLRYQVEFQQTYWKNQPIYRTATIDLFEIAEPVINTGL